ncbi:MAG: NADPH-dependent FMN reductase [Eubacteriales bacterium]|nr:NADPH-dependent FMN reductase [Eubacteriales bacterium]
MNKKSILMITGSLRAQSFNRQLAEKAAALIGDRAEVRFLEYADLPYMNQDIEFPAPEAVARVRGELAAADAVWIFSPEYNFNIPGVLKNLLDWLSRPLKAGDFSSGTAVAGKPVTISGAGGKNATATVRKHLDALLPFMKMKLMNDPETGITVSPEGWGSNVLTLSAGDEQTLSAQVEAFLKFIA